MASEQLKSYPSGFLGGAAVPQTQPTNVFNRTRSLLTSLNPIGMPKVSHHTANETVLELWMDTLADRKDRPDWSEAEDIVKAAVAAFGCTSFVDWVITQGKSPDYSEHHANWIDETILYLYTDKSRGMSHNNWRTILIPGGLRHPPEPYTPVVRRFMLQDPMTKYGTPVGAVPDLSVKGVVQTWVQKPGGLMDLMASMYVLFGPR